MGWTEYPPGRIQTCAEETAEMTRILTWESDVSTTEPVKLTKIGSVWYGAVRVTPKPGLSLLDRTYEIDADGGFTFGIVFLTARDRGCWRYKDMTECMGPVESRAPSTILKLLSPIKDPDSYAHAWRARCEAWNARPRFKTGDRVRLQTPVTLQNGVVVCECTLSTYRRGSRNMTCYVDCATGTRFRMGADTLLGAELVPPQGAQSSDVLAEFYARKTGAET